MDWIDIIEQWQLYYCNGHPMPQEFRQCASRIYEEIRRKCKNNEINNSNNILKTNNSIYRIISCTKFEYRKQLIKFDDLYYSFSNDLQGLSQVCKKDRNLITDILLIKSRPREALNYNNLGKEIFENYMESSRFSDENEIISKCYIEDIDEIYYLKSYNNILDYETNGIKINNNDYKLKINTIYKKYKLK